MIQYKELGHVIMEAHKTKCCRVSQQAQDPGELVVQMRSEGILLENSLLPRPFVLLRASTDWVRSTCIVEGIQFIHNLLL